MNTLSYSNSNRPESPSRAPSAWRRLVARCNEQPDASLPCSLRTRSAGWNFRRAARLLGSALSIWILIHPAIPALAGSLWRSPAMPRALAHDRRATAVGDILSVIIDESSTLTKDANTSTSKKSGVDASLDTVLFSPGASGFLTHNGKLPALKFNATTSFDGGGKINNKEKLGTRMAVLVKDVLPNGNLLIEGRRQTAFAGEVQDAVLRGYVREADVTANNTVYSYQVAEATISIVSKGPISNNQKKGWFTRFWDRVSPF